MATRMDGIISAVATKLTGLSLTGDNVFRSHFYMLEDNELPAIMITVGSDNHLGDDGVTNLAFIDSDLTVSLKIVAKSTTPNIDSIINTIRRDIHVALMADHTQGKNYILNTIPTGASGVNLETDSEKPVATMDIDWVFRYRTPLTDLEE